MTVGIIKTTWMWCKKQCSDKKKGLKAPLVFTVFIYFYVTDIVLRAPNGVLYAHFCYCRIH